MNLADINQISVKLRFLYLQMVAYMASVDGNLDQSELVLLENMCHRFELPDLYKKQVLEIKALDSNEVESGFKQLQTQQLQYSFILDLIIMAMADGILHDAERVFLAKINDWVQIPRAEFHNLIYFAQCATSIEDTDNIDPMMGYVIGNFYTWARKKHVKLFHQTHFAFDESVDRHLKNEL